MSTHVILGTGSIGAPLAHTLCDRGHQVISVNRSGSRAGLPDSVDLRTGDLANPAFAAAAIAGADVVHQLTQPPYHRWAREFPDLQRVILNASAGAGARVVLADNLYCYGRPSRPITAASPEEPDSLKGRVRKNMADAALAEHRAGRVQVALTRPSDYFGPGYALTRRFLTGPARAGKAMTVFGRTDRKHSFSCTVDVARAMADIGEDPDAFGRAWVLPVMAPLTQAELCQAVWEAAGQSGVARIAALRGVPMRLVGLFNKAVKETVEIIYEWDEEFLVDASEFESRFGWKATPVAEAVDAAMKDATRQ
jgi:nucleoside-diphosphate-sugar epimerase